MWEVHQKVTIGNDTNFVAIRVGKVSIIMPNKK